MKDLFGKTFSYMIVVLACICALIFCRLRRQRGKKGNH